jgi:hypothetical protein
VNLDLPYIDYPTGWAIQRAGDIDHHEACSAQQTGGAMLCDCNGLIYKWADLKWKHERAKSAAEVVAGVRAWCAINEIAAPPLDWEGLGEFLTRVGREESTDE